MPMQEKVRKNKIAIFWENPLARTIFGYGATVVLMVALTLIVVFLNIPNPNMILIMGLTICTALFGYGPGALASIDMVLYSLYFFSDNHSWIHFQRQNVIKMLVILIGVLVVYFFVGELHRRQKKSQKELNIVNQQLQEDNQKLLEVSYLDPLTHAKNRLAFRRDVKGNLEKEIFASVIDLDDFKAINDTYGHSLGDKILMKLAKAIQDSFGFESCYRYGGDEFIVLYPGSEEEFLSCLKKVEALLRQSDPDYPHMSVSISAGYVKGIPHDEAEMATMLSKADEHLYIAKHEGKARHHGGRYNHDKD